MYIVSKGVDCFKLFVDVKVKLWDMTVEGLDCGDNVANWISVFLGGQTHI